MDILIEILQKQVLESRIAEFVEILSAEPHEYWREEHFKLQLPGKFDLSAVAFSGSLIVGYIIASLKETSPYIHKFIVRKEFRSMSIGEKILAFFEKNLSDKGFSLIKLAVREDNGMAIRFYEKNLFTIAGKRPDSKDNSTLIIMTKNIL
jgi:ribosomal protein S18 acetylase RimI-like enzyme